MPAVPSNPIYHSSLALSGSLKWPLMCSFHAFVPENQITAHILSLCILYYPDAILLLFIIQVASFFRIV